MNTAKQGAKHHNSTLTELLGDDDHEYRYSSAEISLHTIIVLPQPRITFENIPELALDVAKKGLLNPPTIARFKRQSFERYLKAINRLWKTKFRISSYASTSHGYYYVLLAGERRFRSCKLLWQKGCIDCQEKYKQVKPGECFKKHFKSSRINVRLCIDIPPLPALFLQLSENTHLKVPPHEEARAYAQLFSLLKRMDRKYTIKRFASRVGRGPCTISNALRFCDLPVRVQAAVEKETIRYGIAIELTRLHRADVKSKQLVGWWMKLAITKQYSIFDFRSKVTQFIQNKQNGQTDLLGIMTVEAEKLAQRTHIRQTVERSTINAIHLQIHYLRVVIDLLKSGQLGLLDSPFSHSSPVKVIRKLIDLLQEILPHLRKLSLMKERDLKKSEKTVSEVSVLVDQLEKKIK